MSFYVPSEEEREIFERHIEKEGLRSDREIQEAWHDFCDELEDYHFRSRRTRITILESGGRGEKFRN